MIMRYSTIALKDLLAPGEDLEVGRFLVSSKLRVKLPGEEVTGNCSILSQPNRTLVINSPSPCVSNIPKPVDTPTPLTPTLQFTTTSQAHRSLPHSQLLALNCMYTNATSLNSLKLAELQLQTQLKQTHLVFVSETWFNPTSAKVLHGYNTTNHDRTGKGGGVAIFSKSDLNVTVATVFTTIISEQVWVQLTLANEKLLIGCIYRPPNATHQITNDIIKNIKLACKLIKKKTYDGLILTGDFNLPNIQWSDSMPYTTNTTDEHSKKFIGLLTCEALIQNIHFPTFTKASGEPTNTLDYIISESQNRILSLSTLPPLGSALQGHLIIEWTHKLNLPHQYAKSYNTRLNFKKGDYSKLSKIISNHDWPTVLDNKSVGDSYKCFLSIYRSACDSCIPKLNPNIHKKLKQPWMNSDLLQLVKLKKSLFNKNRASNWKHEHLVFLYHQVRTNLKKLCKTSLSNYELSLVEDKLNPKRLFAYVKSHQKNISSIDSICVQNSISVDRLDIANTLNSQFHSVFVNDQPSRPLPFFPSRTNSSLDTFTFSPQDISKLLAQLNAHKSIGPDGISPYVLRYTADAFVAPLTIIFSQSLDQSSVPQHWSDAHISPIYKKGNKTDPSNYRPISLTSVMCKIMEKLVRNSISLHLVSNKLISSRQHGFVSNKACNTNLLECTDFTTSMAHKQIPTDMILLDFAKAFDKVSHPLLLHKLVSYGLSGKALAWIKAFLSNRRQKVILGSVTSDWQPVLSGVPQGSVLGPLLFIIYINDLPDHLTNKTYLFADDTKMVSAINPASATEDIQSLQSDIDSAFNWTDTWLMQLNSTKCKVMHLGKRNPNHQYTIPYKDGNQRLPLDSTTHERDLGVIVSSNLKSSLQCKKAAAKAYSIYGMLKKAIYSRKLPIWKLLYTTYIRPHLEFAIPVWNPYLIEDISTLESVQRKVTKTVTSISHLPYDSRCKAFNITNLELRRTRGDLLQQYKISNHIDNIEWHTDPVVRAPRGGHRGLLVREVVKNCNIRHNFYTNRVVNPWNSLPDEIVEAKSVNSFKSKLDKFMTTSSFLSC